ncbi:ABC transporter substrate-binding protein [Paenibacillus naphthalenovorans]|uniref:Leu/Ile/Val/Thr/Ala-binding protein n=1 Tax=Paenibacillus naphthalenovorans TaxID=162209 RepID=A0A0U2MX06_9BACL|nr:ABC transporter substrate-binding protein [Paenibacillus naphthalenovorans]ALS22559.1 Leu/Ile/Val/Thr/Ala-binding protein [Paenibacillus naphthalenovorans]
MKRRFFITAALATMMVFTAGCAAKDGGANAGGTIQIGLSAPISGTQAQYGEAFKNGAELAAKQINEAGGIDGKQVKIVIEDDKGDPSEAVNVANKFSSNKDILAVVGHFNSSATLAAAPVYNQNKIVEISPSSSAPGVTNAGDYTFRVITTDAFQASFLAKWSKELGYQKVALIYEQSDFGLGLLDVYQKSARENGIEIVAAESYLPGAKEFSTILTKIKEKKPDAIFIGGFYNEAALIASQAQKLNLSVDYIGVDSLYSEALLDLGGAAVENFKLIGFFYPGGNNEQATKFDKAYQDAYGNRPDTYAAYAFDATSVVIEAIKQGGPDRESIKTYLDTLKDFPGTTGVLTFDENGDVQTIPEKLTIKNGHFVLYQ